ncbi:MAG: MerR family transcriptional regulator [Anaerolineae bacterium]|nr:MerR family transcriptional regulator [Anaerolineae bacterium]
MDQTSTVQVDRSALEDSRPLYTIATAAELLELHPRTLRLYEQAGLIKPARKNNRRFYSNSDLEWVRIVRHLIHDEGLNQQGLRRMLAMVTYSYVMEGETPEGEICRERASRTVPCWDHASAGTTLCHTCPIYLMARTEIVSMDGNGSKGG